MNRLIPTPVVLDRLGRKSKSWLYTAVRNKEAPEPVEPGLWLESEIDAYIEAKVKNRTNTIGRPKRGNGGGRPKGVIR